MAGAAFPIGYVLLNLGEPWVITGPVPHFMAVTLASAGTYGVVTGLLAAGTVWIAKRTPDELGPGTRIEESRTLNPPVDN